MLYNYFTGTSSLADAAWSIAQLIFRKFGTALDVVGLYNSLLWKLRAVYNSFSGDFSWWDLGGVILDLAEFIISIIPAAQIANIISVLWGSANLL